MLRSLIHFEGIFAYGGGGEIRLEVCSFSPIYGYSIVFSPCIQQDILFPSAVASWLSLGSLETDRAFSLTLLFLFKIGLARQVLLHVRRSVSISPSTSSHSFAGGLPGTVLKARVDLG